MKTIKVIILLLFLSALLWFFYCIITLPDLSGLGNKTRNPSISVLDDDRKIMGSSGDVYAGSTNYKDISDNLIDKALKRVNSKFSWKVIAEKLEKIYQKEIENFKYANN